MGGDLLAVLEVRVLVGEVCNWVRKAEVDQSRGRADGAQRARARGQAAEANEILRKASAYFARAELDRPSM